MFNFEFKVNQIFLTIQYFRFRPTMRLGGNDGNKGKAVYEDNTLIFLFLS